MNLDAWKQQAREALDPKNDVEVLFSNGAESIGIERLYINGRPLADLARAVLELAAEVERLQSPVVWRQLDYEDGDTWECSGCQHMTVWEESPEDNEVEFCSHCGHPVKFERYVDPSEDDEE